MKRIKPCFFLFTLLIIACNNEPTSVPKLSENTSKIKDTIPEKIIQPIHNIDSFLLHPFDLYHFKQKTSANSSGAEKSPYYFKPKYKGVYYSFFLFQNSPNEHLYRGQDPNGFVSSEDGFEMISYKPIGKYADQYADPNEELIALTARYNHTALPELALNGLDSFQIKQLLGKPLKRLGNHWFYTHKDRVLTLRFHEKYVNYIKYIHLNQTYTPAIDAALLE
jgi:hypothetical protein